VFWTDDIGNEHEWAMPTEFIPAHQQYITGFPNESVASLLNSSVTLQDGQQGTVLIRKGLTAHFLVRLTAGGLCEVHRQQICSVQVYLHVIHTHCAKDKSY